MNFHPLSPEESKSFDTLRWMSAYIVLIWHTVGIYFNPNWYPATIGGVIAHAAVIIFFIMSGFLIGKSIIKSYATDGFSFSKYIGNRAIRIWPPLLLTVILSFIFYKITKAVIPAQTELLWVMDFAYKDNLGALLFLNGIATPRPPNYALWSLPMEVWMYVLAGLVATRKKFFIFIAAFLYVLIFKACHEMNSEYNVFLYSSFTWLLGFALAFLHNDNFRKIPKYTNCIILAIGIFITFAFGYVYSTILFDKDKFISGIGFSLIFLSVLIDLMKNKKLNLNLLPDQAAYSYTLYVIHVPTIFFIYFLSMQINKNSYMNIVLAILSMLVAVFISKYFAKFVENKNWIQKIIK